MPFARRPGFRAADLSKLDFAGPGWVRPLPDSFGYNFGQQTRQPVPEKRAIARVCAATASSAAMTVHRSVVPSLNLIQ
jgi:hypothetical protein